MNVSFGANALYRPNVKRIDLNTRKYKTYKAAFVEIDPKNDLKALATASDNWNDGFTFLENIVTIITNKCYRESDKIYALTSQTKDFENLDPDDLLGVVLVNCADDKYNTINFLQTNPYFEYIRGYSRFFKGIGKSIIRCIKREAKDKGLKTFSTRDAVTFYKKYGFESSPTEIYAMYWKNPKSNLNKCAK
ncbi:MAG: GNAT family N-acetyltransferase [bacterium]|nr:GNAT family N-acetyltransferase [bacterium]